MKKTLVALALAGLALAGCGSTISDSDPVKTEVPAHVLTETDSQTLTELLLPPTDAQPQEVTKGSLGVFIEDYAPQPALDTFLDTYLPEEDK